MNNNITTKKAFLLLACIWFIITFSIIQTTYAKYVTNLNANTNISISYWNILVNEQDIVENSDISGSMSCVFPGSTYAKSDVIVPGATGYFDLNIDSSKVSVPFKLTVTSAINETSTLTTDLKEVYIEKEEIFKWINLYDEDSIEFKVLNDVAEITYEKNKDIKEIEDLGIQVKKVTNYDDKKVVKVVYE